MNPSIAKRHKRLTGFLIDFVFYGFAQWLGSKGSVLLAVMFLATPFGNTTSAAEVTETFAVWGSAFWGISAFFLNWGVFQGLTGQSFGKKVVGIKVIHEDGTPITVAQSFGRSLLYLVSSIPAWLGFLAIFTHREARCIHDWICRTIVVDAPNQAAIVEGIIPQSRALVPTVIYLPSQLSESEKKAS